MTNDHNDISTETIQCCVIMVIVLLLGVS